MQSDRPTGLYEPAGPQGLQSQGLQSTGPCSQPGPASHGGWLCGTAGPCRPARCYAVPQSQPPWPAGPGGICRPAGPANPFIHILVEVFHNTKLIFAIYLEIP